MSTDPMTPTESGSVLLTTSRKALSINLDPTIYGTFAEIGAGQEVVRNFFKAGGASGTVAKSMSAYDMKFSDDIYGKAKRYVSRERLGQMLGHEYDLVVERLDAERGENARFFAFANTVATTGFRSGGDGHAWMGLRYQSCPRSLPNEIHVHVRLWDKEASHQQDAVGIVGVNLLYAVFFLNHSPEQFLRSLVENVGTARVEVDFIHGTGPDFENFDNRVTALRLVEYGLTNAVAFGEDGLVKVPMDFFYKKSVVVERGLFRPLTIVSVDMMARAAARFVTEDKVKEESLLRIFEISVAPPFGSAARVGMDHSDMLARVDLIAKAGFSTMVSDFREFYRLPAYFRRYMKERVAFVAGINNLVDIFSDAYYTHLDGGVLEACGRLFKDKVRMYVYPMKRAHLLGIIASSPDSSLFEKSVSGDEATVITAEDVPMRLAVRNLYAHLLVNGLVRPLDEYDPAALDCRPRTLLERIRSDSNGWENEVPSLVVPLIRSGAPWGCGTTRA